VSEISAIAVELRYHVPNSQVWERSGGRARGHVHLHVLEPFKSGRLQRATGQALCSKKRGTYERPAEEGEALCPSCVVAALRHGLAIPDIDEETF
jgi:hypothetical protein